MGGRERSGGNEPRRARRNGEKEKLRSQMILSKEIMILSLKKNFKIRTED